MNKYMFYFSFALAVLFVAIALFSLPTAIGSGVGRAVSVYEQEKMFNAQIRLLFSSIAGLIILTVLYWKQEVK